MSPSNIRALGYVFGVIFTAVASPALSQTAGDDRAPTTQETGRAQYELHMRLQSRLAEVAAFYRLHEDWVDYCRKETDRKAAAGAEGQIPFRTNYTTIPSLSFLKTVILVRERWEYQDGVLCLANVNATLTAAKK